jgi:hypothetical protein
MYQGQMFAMKSGAELRFEIGGTYTWGSEVLVRARNTLSGENFSGRLLLLEKGGASTSVITNGWGLKAGEIQTSSDENAKVAKGIIKGDKGTIISLILDTQMIHKKRPGGGAPFFYQGIGEGVDNSDNRYRVQFSGEWLLYWHKNNDDFLKATSKELVPKD